MFIPSVVLADNYVRFADILMCGQYNSCSTAVSVASSTHTCYFVASTRCTRGTIDLLGGGRTLRLHPFNFPVIVLIVRMPVAGRRLPIAGHLSVMMYEGGHSSVVVADNYVRLPMCLRVATSIRWVSFLTCITTVGITS